MRLKFVVSAALLILTFAIFPLQAQISQPNHIEALRISSPIVMDGILSEPAWQKAMHISNFTQRELNEGQPATERTEVAILYDDNNL